MNSSKKTISNYIQMKKIFLPVLLILFMAFQCCTSKTQRSRKPVSTVSLTPDGKNYIYNQSIQVTVKTKIHDGELKEARLFLNNELLTVSDQLEFSYTIDQLTHTGLNTLKVVAVKSDDNSNTRLHNFTVLSEKPPQRYNYRIVKEYPHSTEHFTQGLEFHNGYLFEGTGEHGKSGIYKTDYPSGRILQSQKLSNQYFGEGITILKDKLYQLTYKSQIGFVYRVSDFAVVDSFRFESKEGWGLTNDGNFLIMSDGTETLTWINPEDYSIEKKIQVVDHQKVWPYINELEYDNGFIWANVWTTNQIIRIDAANGKVTGIADLEGILSVMHASQAYRIDVLNGIALHPKTGNLFVTGKLWPKMFELELLPE